MSGCVGLQSAYPPAAAWLSAVSVGGPFLEGCALGDEPDSETSPHPASTRSNKDAPSAHPNRISLSRATMVAPSLTVTACVSYGNRGLAHRGTALTNRLCNMSPLCRLKPRGLEASQLVACETPT